jgi:hypothetical protein
MQRYKDLSTALATVSVSNFAGLTATQEGTMGRIRLRSFRHPMKKAEVFHGSNDSTCHVGPCGGVRIGLTLAADLVHRYWTQFDGRRTSSATATDYNDEVLKIARTLSV